MLNFKLRKEKSNGKRKGFTLMELLIVLGILVVLIGIARNSDWADEYSRYSTTQADMDTIVDAIKTYESMRKDKKLPATLGDLVTGVTKEQSKSKTATGKLVDKENWTTDSSTFLDQWDQPITYDPSARTLTSTNNGGDPIVRSF